ncbi:hypothetical protein ACOMHN_034697 [Nucella lapillus]
MPWPNTRTLCTKSVPDQPRYAPVERPGCCPDWEWGVGDKRRSLQLNAEHTQIQSRDTSAQCCLKPDPQLQQTLLPLAREHLAASAITNGCLGNSNAVISMDFWTETHHLFPSGFISPYISHYLL